ncbi:4-amino-4-deoxychorismate lyase [Fontibacillus phaseoli]|uniref:4-amino-4-deoxychorismate lyase n=1 Tax=Fontibacillus phaseoli TaxID=1416533 RepID=A0A369B0K7_9BACL|nr:aminotransferase class IV [Fontibacillus phaseoli]RCX14941.1 4-amino-4-deoxychorismate lyase [Fontibacillus phaseoli]
MKYIGVNGVPTPSGEAVISVMDHGFMYGMGLFETLRTYSGEPCLLDRHLTRLNEGCGILGIPYEADAKKMQTEIGELLALNGLSEAYIRLTVSAGEGPLGLTTEKYSKPAVILYAKPLPPVNPVLYTLGKQLWLLRTRRNTPESDVRLKSLHYMNNLLARRELAVYEARETAETSNLPVAQGASPSLSSYSLPAEGMLLTAEGHLAEGIASNLFFIEKGKLYTPEIGTGILPGITRAVVIELAAKCRLAMEEGKYTWDRLARAEEVFVTNSVQELVPVTLLAEPDGKRIGVGDGEIGRITRQLLYFYRESVGRQHAQ